MSIKIFPKKKYTIFDEDIPEVKDNFFGTNCRKNKHYIPLSYRSPVVLLDSPSENSFLESSISSQTPLIDTLPSQSTKNWYPPTLPSSEFHNLPFTSNTQVVENYIKENGNVINHEKTIVKNENGNQTTEKYIYPNKDQNFIILTKTLSKPKIKNLPLYATENWPSPTLSSIKSLNNNSNLKTTNTNTRTNKTHTRTNKTHTRTNKTHTRTNKTQNKTHTRTNKKHTRTNKKHKKTNKKQNKKRHSKN
jgi:hypothetical protein